ncbi:hypothetical protein HDF16_005858 [Granulicella aggregans]|uniref:Uncharacterized protein n=1 Tax=Granulicella aggregans TaxID=474949 RepID=A0A7W7ZJW3_9BACT|nr:hypothetical protein [Granulicella aggregans]
MDRLFESDIDFEKRCDAALFKQEVGDRAAFDATLKRPLEEDDREDPIACECWGFHDAKPHLVDLLEQFFFALVFTRIYAVLRECCRS